jgi:4-amino-4-deoxy-L-arabinose transferase-like glycosyltransferase
MTKKLLITVLILGAILRLSWLGTIPSGFFRDEAAIGYNAYSIFKTGADEFGMRLPLVFRSFEVFFLPAYLYISAPIVGLLGLSEFSTRLISTLSGIAAIYIVYLIAKNIWDKKAGIFAAFVLAISPWHIFYSRGTFEGNLGLTLFTAGFYFWIRFLQKLNTKHFLFSGILFALSMYSYQAERVVVPLFIISALIVSFNNFWKIKTKLILPIIILFILMIPLLSLTFKPGGYHRAVGVSIFSQITNPPGWISDISPGVLINNKTYLRVREVSSLYLSYFSPRNLFNFGDYNRQRSVENSSVFYSFMIIGLVFGIWKIIKKGTVNTKLLMLWLVFAPVPAALTGDPFHTYRALLVFIPFSILIGYGFSRLSYQKIFLGVSLISLSIFVFNYFFVTQVTRAHDWDWGYKEMSSFINTLPKDQKIVINDLSTESYIHYLFFNKVEPTIYQKEVASLGNVSDYYYSDPSEIRPTKIDSLEFRKVDWPTERGNTKTVFVMWGDTLPDSEYENDPKVRLLKKISYPDGSDAFKIVEII